MTTTCTLSSGSTGRSTDPIMARLLRTATHDLVINSHLKDSVTGKPQLEVSVHISNETACPSVFIRTVVSVRGSPCSSIISTANLMIRKIVPPRLHNRCGIHHHTIKHTQDRYHGHTTFFIFTYCCRDIELEMLDYCTIQ